jgi:lactoylglutathione lyase
MMMGEVLSPAPSEAVADAICALEDQAMPLEEIAAMVRAHDPELVHRYLELHRERLEERLAGERRTLDGLERLLVEEWSGRPRHGSNREEGGVMISGVSNIFIPVDDQGRAKTFWTETIGFEVVVDAPYREERWIEVRSSDGVRLVLSTREEWSRDDRAVPEDVPTSGVMFRCDDVETTYRELSARGVRFPRPPIRMSFGWWSMFNDTEGNRFALGQTGTDER